MKILLSLIIAFSMFSASAQMAPKDMLSNYREKYLPTLTGRHNLFLLEFNRARLLDYQTLYNLNVKRVNEISAQFTDLNIEWKRLVRSTFDHPEDLALLATLKAQAENLHYKLEESTRVLGGLSESSPKACEAETISWMEDRFLPTKIYQIPHYVFNGTGANNNLGVTFQMNYSGTFGGSDPYGPVQSGGSGSAQIGNGSKEATGYAAAGMVVGIVVGSIVPGIGTTVGGYVGMAVGAAVGSIISSAGEMKRKNKEHDEMKRTFEEMNLLLVSSHSQLDTKHKEMIYKACNETFSEQTKEVLATTYTKSFGVLSQVKNESDLMKREWDEVKNHNQERLSNHLSFLKLLSEGYEINFEEKLEEMHDQLIVVNDRLNNFYSKTIAPALSQSNKDDVYAIDNLISMQIQGDAEFGHQDFELYSWPFVNDKISAALEAP